MINPNLSMGEETQEMAAIATRIGLQLTGHILGTVKRAATGKEEIVFDQGNDINAFLKNQIEDAMNSNVDFALDNLQATQVAQASLSASLNGKGGILVYNHDTAFIIDNALAFMATAVHPTDPEGSYPTTFYRQWQGIYQNLTGGAETAKAAGMGQGYTHSPTTNPPFLTSTGDYATSNFADVTLQNNDIITINWKITVG